MAYTREENECSSECEADSIRAYQYTLLGLARDEITQILSEGALPEREKPQMSLGHMFAVTADPLGSVDAYDLWGRSLIHQIHTWIRSMLVCFVERLYFSTSSWTHWVTEYAGKVLYARGFPRGLSLRCAPISRGAFEKL